MVIRGLPPSQIFNLILSFPLLEDLAMIIHSWKRVKCRPLPNATGSGEIPTSQRCACCIPNASSHLDDIQKKVQNNLTPSPGQEATVNTSSARASLNKPQIANVTEGGESWFMEAVPPSMKAPAGVA
jgi:hypothetical protein